MFTLEDQFLAVDTRTLLLLNNGTNYTTNEDGMPESRGQFYALFMIADLAVFL
jgi:hypothetical protein